jgi:hypothetical protein
MLAKLSALTWRHRNWLARRLLGVPQDHNLSTTATKPGAVFRGCTFLNSGDGTGGGIQW